jgi:ribosomal protein S27AE
MLKSTLISVASVKRKRRPRTVRRELTRAQQRLAVQREKLFALEGGGSAERPLEVSSSSVVEVHARRTLCPRCDASHEIEEHAATTISGVRLRQVRLRCRQCGTRRSLWFRLTTTELS